MLISAIAAYSKNKVIGKNNDMPWHMPQEFAHFKRTTLNHHILMGRKSLEALPGVLPKRTHLVISRQEPSMTHPNVLWFKSIEAAVTHAKDAGETELFICGGAQIYEQCMRMCDYLYLSEIDLDIPDGDAFFPDFDQTQWQVIEENLHPALSETEPAWVFRKFARL
ncbi:MAG TPA: dihydrofolate reductase [Oligoflexia bacterium]|nr:dihydrofolate reductase [Oligoflexia bacterium]HMR24222.1 dihydrofolate reductase [Oligoflexia bacterium]